MESLRISLRALHELPELKIESRALKYGYANARIKGMKGLLLKGAVLDELMHVRTIEGMVELLERTHYRDELVALSLRYKGSYLVELAANRHFAKIVQKVKKLAPKTDAPVIESLLRRWDLLNIKILLDSRRSGKAFDDIGPYLVPVGSLGMADFESITKLEDAVLEAEILRLIIDRGIVPATEGEKKKDSTDIRLALDTTLYELIDSALSVPNSDLARIRKVFRKEADAKNILIIFRLKAHGMPHEQIRKNLVRGGSLKEYDIRALLDAKDISEAPTVLKSFFRSLSIGKIESVVDLEIALEKAVAYEKVRVFQRSMLSIGVLLGFILLKEEELHNIRKIAKAKEFGLSYEDVKKTLVVV